MATTGVINDRSLRLEAGDPTAALGVATKQYVDNHAGNLTLANLGTVLSTGYSGANPGLNGIYLRQVSGGQFTDTSTAAGGTVANVVFNQMGAASVASSNATAANPVTYGNLMALHLAAPSAGANVTVNNAWSLYTDGSIYCAGALTVVRGANINAPALGSVAGNSTNVLNVVSSSTNGEALQHTLFRQVAGTSWTSAFWRVTRYVDTTPQGYIQYGDGQGSTSVSLGAGTTNLVVNPTTVLIQNVPLQVNSHVATYPTQGGYIAWNQTASNGEMDFVNNIGGGIGGFNWYNTTTSAGTALTTLMTLSQTGQLAVIGNINAVGGTLMATGGEVDLFFKYSNAAAYQFYFACSANGFTLAQCNSAGSYIGSPINVNQAGAIAFQPAVAGAQVNVNTTGTTWALSINDTGGNGAGIHFAGNGTTTPSKTIRAQGGAFQMVNNAYNGVPSQMDDVGNWSGNNWTNNSDRRLKENIEYVVPLAGLADRVAAGWTTFNWILSGDDDCGQIAQDVLEFAPRHVKTYQDFDGNDRYSVDYVKLAMESLVDLTLTVQKLRADVDRKGFIRRLWARVW